MSYSFPFSFFSSCYISLLLVLALFHFCLSNQNSNDVLCMDDERHALLQFKQGLVDEADRLASWVGEKNDCCRWAGIVCDNFTGHVHRIHLPGNCRHEEDSKQRLRGDLSPSLLYLKQLEHLDLSCNDFGGIQVPSFMGSLGNLRYLNLSSSKFGGTIPPQLGNLSKLHTLCLGSSYGGTSVRNMLWLSSLRLLHHLDMGWMDLSKATNWLQVINTLPSLVELHLSYCQLSHIHPHVATLNVTSLSLLDLSGNDFKNSFVPRWIFSITNLVSLDLTWCNFQGPIPSRIDSFRNLTSLKHLHVRANSFMNSSLVLRGLSSVGSNLISLDISSCGVSSSILGSLNNLTSLLSLDLLGNQLTKTISKSLGNLCNLRHIDLEGNNFRNISLTRLLESFFECKSPSLESLSLEFSGLQSHLPDQLGKLIYLVNLRLGNNRIAGMIPDSIGRLSFLRSLDLDQNLISGPIPYSIGGLSSIEELDLSYNRLNGSLPDSLGQLSKLNYLHLSGNLLTGVVTEAHFAKLARLKYLDGTGNNLTLRPRLVNWIPSFQLQVLYLSSWDLGPQFPLWLQLQRNLMSLGISNTRISSTVPQSFWRSFPNLRYLDMSQNNIQGRLYGIRAPLLLVLDLSSNEFSGQLPQFLNSTLLGTLDLSNNAFSGSLRHLLCPYGVQRLEVLNLANNHLSGIIPECWVKWPSLSVLNLENNNLSGNIPRTWGSLSSLRSLNSCNNKLSGIIPVSLKNLMNLQMLQLAGNELVGRIPVWFGRELPSLGILNLRSNNFDGNIPHKICYLNKIQILDLAENNLSGNIPKCFKNFSVLSGKETTSNGEFFFSAFIYTEVKGSASLVIKGREDTYSTILRLVMVLDLSSNNFFGHIPSELTALRVLQSLNLSRNRLTGRIPEKIGDLKFLESFDVSFNGLSGELPVSFSSLSFLSRFNVSFNNLTGRVPSSTQLQSFNESSFFGNKLCGNPLTKRCVVEVPYRDQEEHNGSPGGDWGLIISLVFGFIAGFWVIVAPLIVSTAWRFAYFRFLSELRYMFCDVIRKYCCNMLAKC